MTVPASAKFAAIPTPLVKLAPTSLINNFGFQYVPSSDGKRFLVSTATGQQRLAPPMRVVTDWYAWAKRN